MSKRKCELSASMGGSIGSICEGILLMHCSRGRIVLERVVLWNLTIARLGL